MSVKSLKKQMMAAVATTMVGAVALSSATYAWFAINSKVTATGMNFTTKVEDNLFIASDELGSTEVIADAQFGTTLVQKVTGILEPVSTVDGMSFWYSSVNNVNGNGSVKNDEWFNYGTVGLIKKEGEQNNNFNSNYNTEGAVGFVDYVYQLKAIAGTGSELTLTNLELTYADKQKDIDNKDIANTSFRAAVFVEDITSKNPTADKGNDATASSADVAGDSWLFAPSGASNFHDGKAVNDANSTASVEYNDSISIEVPAGNNYYKVVVRVWLEGEDTNCNNTTFAKLDDGKWGLNCEWKLGEGTPADELKITQSEKAKIDLSEATVDDTDSLKINGSTYYSIPVGTKKYYTPNTALTNSSKIYTIDDGQIVEITHLVKLPQ